MVRCRYLSMMIFFMMLVILFLVSSGGAECYTPSCVITMTTYMGFEDRFQHIHRVLDPLVRTGQEIIVINEWGGDHHLYTDFMKKKYPQIRFIQKPLDEKGQARSLNILIRDHLMHSPHKYWIHWEDTWVCARPLLPELIQMMEKNTQVSQLQLTGDWKDMPGSRALRDITILPLPPQEDNQGANIYERKIELGTWPLFSLRPSINRLSFFQRHANDFYFLEDPHLWPLRFEWEFGRIFLKNKGVKAITNKPYAKRIRGHKSTYADLLNGDWKHSKV